MQEQPSPDIRLTDHGSIVLVEGVSPEGEEFVEERSVGGEDRIEFGRAVVVEPRYLPPIIEGALAEGLEVGA